MKETIENLFQFNLDTP